MPPSRERGATDGPDGATAAREYDYRDVACPRCGAKPGGYCARPSGHSGPFVLPHADRKRAAEDAWRAEETERFGEVRSDFLRPETTGAREEAADGAADPAQLALF